MLERRRLAFEGIEAIMPEVDRLLATGYATVGRWSLGMICDHLATSVNLSLDSPPTDTPPNRAQTINRRLFFRASAFPEGQDPPFALQVPSPEADPITAAEALRTALDRLAAHAGPWPSHPVIGPMTRAEWLTFHARHAAHHLSFAVPT